MKSDNVSILKNWKWPDQDWAHKVFVRSGKTEQIVTLKEGDLQVLFSIIPSFLNLPKNSKVCCISCRGKECMQSYPRLDDMLPGRWYCPCHKVEPQTRREDKRNLNWKSTFPHGKEDTTYCEECSMPFCKKCWNGCPFTHQPSKEKEELLNEQLCTHKRWTLLMGKRRCMDCPFVLEDKPVQNLCWCGHPEENHVKELADLGCYGGGSLCYKHHRPEIKCSKEKISMPRRSTRCKHCPCKEFSEQRKEKESSN